MELDASSRVGNLEGIYNEQKELFLGICNYLPLNVLLEARRTCKVFQELMTHNDIWKPIVQRKFRFSSEKDNFEVFRQLKYFEKLPSYGLDHSKPTNLSEEGDKIPVSIEKKIGLFNLTTTKLECLFPLPSSSDFITNGTKICVVEENEKSVLIFDYVTHTLNKITLHFDNLKKVILTDKCLIAGGRYGEKEAFDIETGAVVWMMDGKGDKIHNPEAYLLSKPRRGNSNTAQHDFVVDKDYMICISGERDKNPKIYNICDGSLRSSISIGSSRYAAVMSIALANDKLYVYHSLDPVDFDPSFSDLPSYCHKIFVYNLSKKEELSKKQNPIESTQTFFVPKEKYLEEERKYGQPLATTCFHELTKELHIEGNLLFCKATNNFNTQYYVLDQEGLYKYPLRGDSDNGEFYNIRSIKVYNDLIFGIGSFQSDRTSVYLLVWSKESGRIIGKKNLEKIPAIENYSYSDLSIINERLIVYKSKEIMVLDLPQYLFSTSESDIIQSAVISKETEKFLDEGKMEMEEMEMEGELNEEQMPDHSPSFPPARKRRKIRPS